MRAPAKLNLCLYLGPPRADGKHELSSVFQPLQLADRITVVTEGVSADEVVCPGVEGENLAAKALAALRAGGWESAPLRIEIDKRIPLAAGLGGGSADAAAVLRLARGQVDGLEGIAAGLGADVPSQIEPAPALVGGAGELVELLPATGDFGAVLIADRRGLSTAAVYAEADRLGLGRGRAELDRLGARLAEAFGRGESPLAHRELLVNDLEPAAIALLPDISLALAALREAGAAHAMVTGSGPTAVGLFADVARADAAAAALGGRYSHALVTAPDLPR